jgi:hypothetical protein
MDPRLHKKLTADGKLGGPTLPPMGSGSGLGHIDRRPPSMPTPIEGAQAHPVTNSGLGMTNPNQQPFPNSGLGMSNPNQQPFPNSGLGMTNPTITPQITPPSTFTPGGVLPHVSMALSGPSSGKGGRLKKIAWMVAIVGSGAAVFYGAKRLAGPRLMSKLSDDYMPELDDDDYED